MLFRSVKALSEQLQLVLDHEQFKALESNWRGLHMLCRRGKGAQIELFEGDFDTWQERVYQTEYAGTNEAPLAMVVLAEVNCVMPSKAPLVPGPNVMLTSLAPATLNLRESASLS